MRAWLELAYAYGSDPYVRKDVRVRISPRALQGPALRPPGDAGSGPGQCRRVTHPGLDPGEQRTWRANRTGVPGFAANECAGETVGFEYSALRSRAVLHRKCSARKAGSTPARSTRVPAGSHPGYTGSRDRHNSGSLTSP
jgi:hypothetical protein